MKNNISELFNYVTPKKPKDCRYLISPSQLYKFFSNPSEWYKTTILGKESEFKGNTATVIGTICHYIFEQYTRGNKDIRREMIDEEIDKLIDKQENKEDYNVEEIKKNYPLVAECLMNNYVIPRNNILQNSLLKVELPVVHKLDRGIYIGGTIDRLELDTVVDYKIVNSKPNESVIPLNYKYQLLAYAMILRELGYTVNHIKIVYGVKPLKTTPPRYYVVNEDITYESEKLIRDTFELIVDTIKLVEEHPGLEYIIFKDIELRSV